MGLVRSSSRTDDDLVTTSTTVGSLLRAWRSARNKSQLALASEAGISSRHLSFVETGRAAPSRDMVLTLAAALAVPLRERNALLTAAGYAAVFPETPLDAPAMAEVRGALAQILAASEPNPAFVVNRRSDVLLTNDAGLRLLSFFAPAWRGRNNIALLVLSPQGLRPAIANWGEIAAHVIHRVRAELAAATNRDAADELVLAHAIAAEAELGAHAAAATATRPPRILVPVQLRRGDVALDLFTTITTVGTPLDVTLQELRIETSFPATAAARAALAVVTGGGADAD
jgi:transcriptional regulator with XRE-family HTH domain